MNKYITGDFGNRIFSFKLFGVTYWNYSTFHCGDFITRAFGTRKLFEFSDDLDTAIGEYATLEYLINYAQRGET